MLSLMFWFLPLLPCPGPAVRLRSAHSVGGWAGAWGSVRPHSPCGSATRDAWSQGCPPARCGFPPWLRRPQGHRNRGALLVFPVTFLSWDGSYIAYCFLFRVCQVGGNCALFMLIWDLVNYKLVSVPVSFIIFLAFIFLDLTHFFASAEK